MKRIGCLILAITCAMLFSACNKVAQTQNSSIITNRETVDSSQTENSSEQTTTSVPETVVPVTSIPVQSVVQSSKPVSVITPSTPAVNNGAVTISYTPKTVVLGKTYTGRPVLSPVQYTLKDPENTRGLSTVRNGFSFGVAKNGQPHSITVENQKRFDGYALNTLAWDNKSNEKVLYLTFDCGYKYLDLTDRLLDTLKEKNVKAAFFCTLDYLEDDPNAVCRMINEGHIVGNHSTTHPDFTAISRKKMAEEVLGANNFLRVNYGYESKYFRFPSGAHSQSALDVVNQTGHRTAFWSVAYSDWDPAGQDINDAAKTQEALNTVTSRLHSGAVILLHSTSPYNVANLGKIIDYAVSQGYQFRSLDQYAFWN